MPVVLGSDIAERSQWHTRPICYRPAITAGYYKNLNLYTCDIQEKEELLSLLTFLSRHDDAQSITNIHTT